MLVFLALEQISFKKAFDFIRTGTVRSWITWVGIAPHCVAQTQVTIQCINTLAMCGTSGVVFRTRRPWGYV